MSSSYELDVQSDELRIEARRLLSEIVRRCKTIGELDESDVQSAKWRSLVTNGEAVELASLLLMLVDKKQRFGTTRDEYRRHQRARRRQRKVL